MLNLLKGLARDTNGTTAIEYGLIVAIVAIGIVTILGTTATRLSQAFDTVSGKL